MSARPLSILVVAPALGPLGSGKAGGVELTLVSVVSGLLERGRSKTGGGGGGQKGRQSQNAPHHWFSFSTAMKASWGTSTLPIAFIRFLPFACFCSSFFFREMSPT